MTHLNIAFEILCLIKNAKKHWGITADEIIEELNKYNAYDVNMGIDYLENHDHIRCRLFTANEGEKSYTKKTATTKREVFFLTVNGEQIIIDGGFSGRSKKDGSSLEVNTDWLPDETHVAAVSAEEAKLIFEQSEKMLQNLVMVNENLVTRMARLLTITMCIMTLFLCYSFFRFDRYMALDIELLAFIIGVGYLFVISIIILLKTGAIKKDAVYVGTEPKILFNDILLSRRSSDNIKQFYISKIIDHQNKILLCKKKNKANWATFTILLWMTVLIPVVILFIYWLLKFFT